MYSCKFYKDFNSIYFTEHPRATASVFCIVFFNFSKPFSTIFQYLKNCNCKLSLKIVWLSQSLTLHCYLRVWKFPQCHCQPDDLRRHFERSFHSVNDHSAIFNIFCKFCENGPCIQTIFLFVWLWKYTPWYREFYLY